MQPRTERHPRAHLRRRPALLGCCATVLALAAGGCASNAPSQQASGTPVIVTAEQVVTTCYHDYFYNGILPQKAARSNCNSCVEQTLRKLGIRPSPGESEIDLLTGVRLPRSDITSLQSACEESDASSQ